MIGNILRFRLAWRQEPRKVNIRRIPCIEPFFNSSRTRKIIGLSSCEAELRAIVSSASDGIYIRSVLDFAVGERWTLTFSQIHQARANLC